MNNFRLVEPNEPPPIERAIINLAIQQAQYLRHRLKKPSIGDNSPEEVLEVLLRILTGDLGSVDGKEVIIVQRDKKETLVADLEAMELMKVASSEVTTKG